MVVGRASKCLMVKVAVAVTVDRPHVGGVPFIQMIVVTNAATEDITQEIVVDTEGDVAGIFIRFKLVFVSFTCSFSVDLLILMRLTVVFLFYW